MKQSGDKVMRAGPSRRDFFTGCAAATILASARPVCAAELSEDGLYAEPWFLQSFLDLREDLRGAKAAGKTFAVLWELKGCPYCKLLHTENFANPAISEYAKANFEVLQLNLIGSRPVIGFDGRQLPEKEMAALHSVEGTPTLQFFQELEDGSAEELGRTQYLKPEAFFGMLRFVRQKGYEAMPFDEWLKANPAKI